MEKTRRVKIVTGLKCNINCVFCYYRDNLKAPNRIASVIAKDLEYAFQNGIREIDFSGGEPTVHPDLPQLIALAREVGFVTVGIISNGLRVANRPYLDELKRAGLDEILFSVHGPNAQVHDEITQRDGSFALITKGMENATAAGIRVRVNTVVNRLNYLDLSALCRFVLRFSPTQVNFITINDWCFAKHLVDRYMLNYSEMNPPLRSACDLLDGAVPAVNVRYIPFCFMKEYERFVCDHRQVSHDPYEWVPRVRCRLEEQNTFWRYLAILGYGFMVGGAWRKAFRLRTADVLDECVVEGLRRRFYRKGPQCRGCSYFELCDGVENTYADKYGFSELRPVAGAAVTDPLHFRRAVS